MKILSSHQLPSTFDPQALRGELAHVRDDEWTLHFNTSDYEGGWSSAALMAVDGDPKNQTNADGDFRPTELLERCPVFRQVLDHFECDKRRVRLLKLDAGARILEHIDSYVNMDFGEIRLHVPVQTDPKVEFYVDSKRVVMEAGTTWYIDATFPHRLYNGSDIDRVHLVIDCVANDWLRSQFPSQLGAPSWYRRGAFYLRATQFRLRRALRPSAA
ncbi:MAG: aspartyl/asparaginyl beta-hydroxylase domain-containing protein [Acidobacteriota bacterium]